jgi:FtsH-binding integral membrane protein
MDSRMLFQPDQVQVTVAGISGLAVNLFVAAIIGPSWLVVACSVVGALVPAGYAIYKAYCLRRLLKKIEAEAPMTVGERRALRGLLE